MEQKSWHVGVGEVGYGGGLGPDGGAGAAVGGGVGGAGGGVGGMGAGGDGGGVPVAPAVVPEY